MDVTEIEQALADRKGVAGEDSDLTGPVQVVGTTPTADGGATYQVTASRLVPVDDQDPDLASVYIPVPVTAAVEVDDHDSVVGVQVPDSDPSTEREARAFTRNLIANGAVRGLTRRGPVRRAAGPPPRSTHEVTTDPAGRRVIRRTGFTLTFGAGPSHDDDKQAENGGTHR